MNRRGFLAGILAAGVAPAIVRADSLMRIVPRETTVLTGSFLRGTTITDWDSFYWNAIHNQMYLIRHGQRCEWIPE